MAITKLINGKYSIKIPGYYVSVKTLSKAKIIEKKAILIWKTKHDIIKLLKNGN